MRLLRIVADETNIPFMRFRKLFIAISSLAVVLSVVLVLVKGMNFGIGFQGGILIEVRMPQAADMGKMRVQLGGLGLGEVSLQEFGDPSDVLIRIGAQEGDETAQQAAINQVKQALGEGVDYRRVEFVGPKVSSELLLDGVLAVAAAIIAMLKKLVVGYRPTSDVVDLAFIEQMRLGNGDEWENAQI